MFFGILFYVISPISYGCSKGTTKEQSNKKTVFILYFLSYKFLLKKIDSIEMLCGLLFISLPKK